MEDRDKRHPRASPARVVILVHGTWAVDARWTRPGSKLRQALAGLSPEVTVEVAKWSGRNSPAARRAGGDVLRARLADLLERHDSADHYLIAHSHGGNVVRYALVGMSPEDKRRIRKVICLATPFVSCRERDDVEQRTDIFMREVLHNKGIFFVGFLLLLEPVVEHLWRDASCPLRVLGGSIVISYLVFWFFDFWRRRLETWIRRRIDEWRTATLAGFSFAERPNPPLLSLTPRGDEPSWWLQQVRRVASIPFRLSGLYLKACFVAGAAVALWVAVVEPGIADGSLAFRLDEDTLLPQFFAFAVGGFSGLAAGVAIAELARWLVPSLTQSRGIGLGRAPWYVHFLTEIRTDEAPAEFERFESPPPLEVPKRRWWKFWELRHSGIYRSDEALERIVEAITGSSAGDRMSRGATGPAAAPRAVALLPAAVLLHQLEEWFWGFPAWVSAALGRELTAERFLLVNAVGLALFVAGSLAARGSPRMAWIGVSLAALAGLNGLLHPVASLVAGSYSPGTVTGLLLYVPVSVLVLRSSAARLSKAVFAGAVAVGILVHALATYSALG